MDQTRPLLFIKILVKYYLYRKNVVKYYLLTLQFLIKLLATISYCYDENHKSANWPSHVRQNLFSPPSKLSQSVVVPVVVWYSCGNKNVQIWTRKWTFRSLSLSLFVSYLMKSSPPLKSGGNVINKFKRSLTLLCLGGSPGLVVPMAVGLNSTTRYWMDIFSH